jgi:Na+/H+-dicarboxylate symporter
MRILLLALAFAPAFANAQGKLGNLEDVVQGIQTIVNMLIPIVAALALIAFFWGLARFIFNANNDEKKGEGKNMMIYGVLALFVLASIWGLVTFLQKSIGIDTETADVSVPKFK